ncbi:uncharacterized protein K02A2.6 [Trichonephila clavata]|uniref:Uncharacterized protein K02A2.6 n=1 Tax=Trichonephila clavata TaxID=2740835 RepID=A0A8X6KTD0_TRICU|nr:uncharacterized protein K02A2.6 [Trichonephila clavata]
MVTFRSTKVSKPTGWVSSLVVVDNPNGKLRIFLDLNTAIKREHHIIPTSEELISILERKVILSFLDLKDEFWQRTLDEESTDICTFNTPFGRYQFLVLPFGIATDPEIFEKRNANLFDVELYFDDVIIAGKIKNNMTKHYKSDG